MLAEDNSWGNALAALATVFVPLVVVTVAARAARGAQPPVVWRRTQDRPMVVGRLYRWSMPTTATPSNSTLIRLHADFSGLRYWLAEAPAGWPSDEALTGRDYFEGRAQNSNVVFNPTVSLWTTDA